MTTTSQRPLGPSGVRRLLEGHGSVQDLTEADVEFYLDLLDEKLESIDGSDTRILQELRAGGHPIAAIDSDGRLVIEHPTAPKAR